MNNKELENFRTKFNGNVEKEFQKKYMMNIKDYEEIIRKTVKETKISNETSNHIYVYMGSYALKQDNISITYNGDKDLVYKKYKDIETGNTINVNKISVDTFEKNNTVIFSVVSDYTKEEYEDLYDMLRTFYFKQLLSSSEEKSLELIKKLTPLK